MRYALLILLLGLVGCQAMPFPSNEASRSRRGEADEGLFAKTSKFFRPSPSSSPQPVAAPPVSLPPSLHAPSSSLNASRLLYDFEAPPAVEQPPSPKVAAVHRTPPTEIATVSTSQPSAADSGIQSGDHSGNPLQPRRDDSPKLRSLLVEIEATPPENLKLSLAETERRVTMFREAQQRDQAAWFDNPQIELQYLALLRNAILPAPVKPKDQVFEEKEELAHRKNTVRRTPTPQDKEQYDEVVGNLPDDEDEENEDEEENIPAPLPPPKVVKKTKSASSTATLASQPKKSEEFPAITQITQDSPQPDRRTSATQGEIVQVSYAAEAPNGDWRIQARLAADLLRAKIADTPNGRSFSNEANLRLLELALGNRQEAVRPFSQVEKPINDFWGHQMLGFSTLLDETGLPDKKSRYATAAYRFDEGLFELRRLCPMKLKNVQFVKDWVTFGVFLPRTEDCRSGEIVGLYLELENPTIKHSTLGYSVKPSIHYEIRDSASTLIFKSKDIPLEETTPSQKRDYCIHLTVDLPKGMAHGQYLLRVSVTDLNSEDLQYAEEQLSFRVLPSRKQFVDE